MILIISDKKDLQIYWVIYYLNKWKIPFILLDIVDYPLKIKHTSIWNKDRTIQNIQFPDGQSIDCSEIKAVWYRKPDYPKIAEYLTEGEKEYTYHECNKDLDGLYNYLQDCFWISPIHNMRRAENKSLQLNIASSMGFSIPNTIITNNQDEAWNFYKKHDGNVVYKTLSTGILTSHKAPWEHGIVYGEIYTTPLKGYQKEDFELVANCPCLFQEYVQKKYEIRITVVGDITFAAEIHSQENSATLYDWRHSELDFVLHKIHELPEELSKKCISLVKKLGLRFGAIDMILTPNDEYIFLEINPNGQYGWIEDKTGLNISEAIADSLVSCNKENVNEIHYI